MEKKQFSTKEQSDLMRAAGEKLSNDIEKYVLPHLTPQPQSIQEPEKKNWFEKLNYDKDGELLEALEDYPGQYSIPQPQSIQEDGRQAIPNPYLMGETWVNETISIMLKRIHELESQPQAQEDGWISVEKELPKEGDRVLFFDDFGVNIGYVMDEAGQTWKDEISGMLLEFQHTTHWRKLPEPPTKPINSQS